VLSIQLQVIKQEKVKALVHYYNYDLLGFDTVNDSMAIDYARERTRDVELIVEEYSEEHIPCTMHEVADQVRYVLGDYRSDSVGSDLGERWANDMYYVMQVLLK
jgi:hypothetical protein